jgi:hypothetical protein
VCDLILIAAAIEIEPAVHGVGVIVPTSAGGKS